MEHTFYFKRHALLFYYALFMVGVGICQVFWNSNIITSLSMIISGILFIVIANGFKKKRIEIESGEIKCFNAINYRFKTRLIEEIISANQHTDLLYILFRDGSNLPVYKNQMHGSDFDSLSVHLNKNTTGT